MSKPEYSKCCLSGVHVVGDSFGEGTNHYVCNACGEACDITYSQTSTTPTTNPKLDVGVES